MDASGPPSLADAADAHASTQAAKNVRERGAVMVSGSISEMRYTLYVLLAAVLWSTGGLGVKSVDMPPLALAGFRSLFALPVLGLAIMLDPMRGHTLRTLRRPLVWGAAVSYATMVVSFVVAAKLTTAANAILLQYTGPIYVALLSWPLLRERVLKMDIVATAGCFFGMLLFFVDRVSAQGRIGDLVAIVSSFGFAGVPLLLKLERDSSPLVAMTLGNVLSCVVCAPSMVASMSHPVGPTAWGIVAFLGMVQIGVAYWLYGAAVGKLPALRSTLIATIEPILNPLWVAIVRNERPTRWAAVGGAVIVVSVSLQALSRSRKPSA